jgi:hypothetical protein
MAGTRELPRHKRAALGSGSSMAEYDTAARQDAVAYARRYFAGTLTLDTCIQFLGGSGDPLILALLDALIHEPRQEGLMGLREWWWRTRYWEPVERLLGELEKGVQGQVPTERIYPRVCLWSLGLGAVLVLWAGLFAAQNLEKLLTDISRVGSLPFWDALWRSVLVGTLALAAAAGLEGWMDGLRLYRTRKLTARQRD